MSLKLDRQATISRLISEQAVTSQQELVILLAGAGQVATQATVSRDLEELGAVRVRRKGHVVYALPAAGAARPGPGPVLADCVLDVEGSGNLVVVHAPPGYAGMVASLLDATGIEGVLGTVAGDDTILVVCRQDRPAGQVVNRIQQLCARGGIQ